MLQLLPKGNYVGGSFIKPSKVDGYIERHSPADVSDKIGKFPFSRSAVDSAVEAARAAFDPWRERPLDERAACLRRFRENVDTHRDRLIDSISRETGKPRWESNREVELMMERVDITLEDGIAEIAEFGQGGTSGVCRYRPVGVVAVLSPFNFPGHVSVGHLLPALATGCTVVLKPSSLTPGTGQVIADVVDRSKFPRGVFNLVQGPGGKVGRELASHEGVDAVALTGSTRVGQRVMDLTAGQPKLVALEMGGKNAAVVLDDADLDRAAYEICVSAFLTTGQRCTATSRVIAHEKIAGTLADKLAAICGKLTVGYPFDDDVFCGPLVSEDALTRFLGAIEDGRNEGVEPIVAGGTADVDGHRGFYVKPSIHRVTKPDPNSRYQTEEHFGPDIAFYTVKDDDEAIALNATCEYGLALAVFTGDRVRYDRIRRASKEGVINWNRGTVSSSGRLPFGGTGKSGNHRAAALHSVRYCTVPVSSMEDDQPTTTNLTPLPGIPAP